MRLHVIKIGCRLALSHGHVHQHAQWQNHSRCWRNRCQCVQRGRRVAGPHLYTGNSITGAMATIGQQTLMPHDENFKKSKKLGQGGFGTVWLCERSKSKVRSKLLGECERRCRSAALSMEVNLRPYSSNCIYSFASECECGYLRGKYVVHGCWETPSRLEHTPFKPPHEPTA